MPESFDETVHVVTFASPHEQAALQAVGHAIASSGAELASLRVKPVGRLLETTLKVRRLSDEAAERMGELLARTAGVSALRLEHLRALA